MMTTNSTDIAYQESHVADTAVDRLIAVFIICFVISYVSVTLRLVSRHLKGTGLGVDDWLIMVSTLVNTAFLSLNIAMTHFGLGRHQVLVGNLKEFFLGYIVVEFLYTITLFTVKMSTLFLWHRLFPGRKFTTSLYMIGGVVCAYTVTQLVCVGLQCIPLHAMWDPSVRGRCINLNAEYLFYSSVNIATDICIIALPIFQLWQLKMNLKQKLQLAIMFSLGGFVLIISIIRIPQLTEISLTDQSWTLTNSAIWSTLECAVATCSACLPTMRPLFVRLAGYRSNGSSRSVVSVPRRSDRPSFGGRVVLSWGLDGSITAATNNNPPFGRDREQNNQSCNSLKEISHNITSKETPHDDCDESV